MESGDKTRSGLTAAKIVEINDETGKAVEGGLSVTCMFNPYEYTVSKQNSFDSKPTSKGKVPTTNFKTPGPQTLKLKLYFDTFEKQEDVSKQTRKLWEMMAATKPKKASGNKKKNKKKLVPPAVAFEWGVFRFASVIKSMTQKFTLFLHNGVPVRAEVNITFVQHNDLDDYRELPKQNPTSGGGPVEEIWVTQPGDRLDLVASEVYGDATHWPKIAAYNGILNPHKLKAGTLLSIPEI